MITNCGDSNLAIVDVEGYFCNTSRCIIIQFSNVCTCTDDGLGDWVKCDGLKMGVKVDDQYHFDATPNFNIESARTMTKAVQLSIKISGIKYTVEI